MNYHPDYRHQPPGREEELQLFRQLDALNAEINRHGVADSAALRGLEKAVERLEGEIMLANQGLVGGLVRKYSGYGVDDSDLRQEANLGLLTAIRKFDLRRGCRFSTIAMRWICQAVTRALSNQSRTIRIPEHRLTACRRLMRLRETLTERFGEAPDSEELAAASGIPAAEVERLLAMHKNLVSLDAPAGGGTEGLSQAELIEDEAAINPADLAAWTDARHLLGRAMHILSHRERLVIETVFGLNGRNARTVSSLAAELGVCRQRVCQIQQEAIARIRAFVAEKDTCRPARPVRRPHAAAGNRPQVPRAVPPLLMRDTGNPNHHISLNNGTWGCHFMVIGADGRKQRLRRTLRTKDVEVARARRDELIATLLGGGFRFE